MIVYSNVTGDGTTSTLITKSGNVGGNINNVLVTNNGENDVTVRLYLDDGSTEYSIARKVLIPVGASVAFVDGVRFDPAVFNLKIHIAGTSASISVIIS